MVLGRARRRVQGRFSLFLVYSIDPLPRDTGSLLSVYETLAGYRAGCEQVQP